MEGCRIRYYCCCGLLLYIMSCTQVISVPSFGVTRVVVPSLVSSAAADAVNDLSLVRFQNKTLLTTFRIVRGLFLVNS